MRRILVYAVLAVSAALCLASCNKELGSYPNFGDGPCIVLSLDTPIFTKAAEHNDGHRPGDDDGAYNENVISKVDCFIYASNADNTTQSLHHLNGRLTGSYVTVDLTPAQVDAIFPRPNSTCKVLLVANYPADGESLSYNLSYNEVMSKSFTSSFTNGATFTTQENFVMVSDLVSVAIVSKHNNPINDQSQTVTLKRVASKMSLDVTFDDLETVTYNGAQWPCVKIQIGTDDGGDPIYEKWVPHAESMTVYMMNGLNKGSLSGEPAVWSTENSSYFTTYSSGRKFEGPEDRTYKVVTDYTTNPVTTVDETKKYYYTSPFYSYPQTWTYGDHYEPYLKLIIPWQRIPDSANGIAGTQKNYYYRVLCPVSTFEANNWYKMLLSVGILGSDADDLPVSVYPGYYVADWQDLGETALSQQAEILGSSYLSVPVKTHYIYGGNTITIPVVSSDEIKATLLSATYTNFQNEESTTANYSTPASKFSLTCSGSSSFTLTNNLVSDFSSTSIDCSIITFTVKVEHDVDNSLYSETVTIIQYPPIYIEAELNDQHFHQSDWNTYKGYVYINGSNNSGDWQSVNNANIDNNRNHNRYIIHSSVMTIDGFILGDPRVSESTNTSKNGHTWATAPFVGQTSGQSNRQLKWYRPTDESNTNTIAPEFMITSCYGRRGGGDSYANSWDRCAAFQEEGYPAGRWRLPTEAELAYMSTLSAKGLIPTLFYPTQQYWTGNGTAIKQGEIVSGATTASVRCVYDIWYWGKGKVDNRTFTWGDEE